MTAKRITVVCTPTEVRQIHDDDVDLTRLAGGKKAIVRISDVEPDAAGKWWAVMRAGGDRLGPFDRGDQALAAEVAWAKVHGIPVPAPV